MWLRASSRYFLAAWGVSVASAGRFAARRDSSHSLNRSMYM
jgi:hypothetical protein